MMDRDNLKVVNDQGGHNPRDDLLARTGGVWGSVRTPDSAGREGAMRFWSSLPEVTAEGHTVVAAASIRLFGEASGPNGRPSTPSPRPSVSASASPRSTMGRSPPGPHGEGLTPPSLRRQAGDHARLCPQGTCKSPAPLHAAALLPMGSSHLT